VIDEIESREVDAQRRAALIDELVGYEPPRKNGLRNAFIFWTGAFGAAAIANAIGLPGWAGFVAALVFFTWIGRELAVRALRWRLDQILADTPAHKDAQ
jgi:hypothetical protein